MSPNYGVHTAHCTAPRVVSRGHESLLPEGIHQESGKETHNLFIQPVLTQFPLLKVSACEKGCQQDCGAHFGEDQDAERDVTAMDIGSGYRDVEALTLYCC